MPIAGFQYKEFADNLAGQASSVIPQDLSKEDKDYIVNIIHSFCHLAGEALYNDDSLNFNADQACIITQFIGEWTFHKSIDLIKSNVPEEFRNGVLQKIAFTVFEIAKQAIAKNLPQPQMVQVVEHHVLKTYKAALADLQKRGALSAEQAEAAEKHSNIDEMAQEAQKTAPKMPENDNKFLKLVALAIVMKQMPKGKAYAILQKFPKEDAEMIIQYMDVPDLENKLDKGIIMKYLNEIKGNIPVEKKLTFGKMNKQLYKIVKNSNFQQVSNMIYNERPGIKKFVLAPFAGQSHKIPARVAAIVVNHIEEKIKCS